MAFRLETRGSGDPGDDLQAPRLKAAFSKALEVDRTGHLCQREGHAGTYIPYGARMLETIVYIYNIL